MMDLEAIKRDAEACDNPDESMAPECLALIQEVARLRQCIRVLKRYQHAGDVDGFDREYDRALLTGRVYLAAEVTRT